MSSSTVSVIVPTRNRPEQLLACLRALAAAARPAGGLEVIVVNDGGTTPAVPAGVVDGLELKLVDQRRAGPAAARNRGAAAAGGSLLAFTDDDCEPDLTWLEALEARLAHDPSAVVGGLAVSARPDNVWATASQVLIEHLHRWYNRDPDHGRFVTSNNLAMTAATFRELGGFDEAFPNAAAEDREFAERTVRSGRAIVYAPEAVVRHRHRLTGRTFVTQHYGYGRGAYRLLRIRREAGGGMVFESPRFYAELLRAPPRRRGNASSLQLSALLAVSQVAHTVGFMREALARRR